MSLAWTRRAVHTAVAAALLAIGACTPEPAPHLLRVMTWNIAAGRGDLAQTAEVIRSSGADIVALQEVDVHWSERSGFADQAARLAAMLDMDVRFAPIYRLPGAEGSPEREFGVALLSRRPIVSFRNHEITRLSTQADDAEPRPMPGFLDAVVQVGRVTVRVLDTHLDYRPDPQVRAQQVADMLEILGETTRPVILLGDLNAPPDAPELTPLRARLRDVWTGSGSGFTYPADAPVRRIDYILTSGHFAVLDVRVLDTRASDHRPVVADLIVRAEAVRAIRP